MASRWVAQGLGPEIGVLCAGSGKTPQTLPQSCRPCGCTASFTSAVITPHSSLAGLILVLRHRSECRTFLAMYSNQPARPATVRMPSLVQEGSLDCQHPASTVYGGGVKGSERNKHQVLCVSLSKTVRRPLSADRSRSESSRQSTEANLLAAGYGRACSNNYGGHDRCVARLQN